MGPYYSRAGYDIVGFYIAGNDIYCQDCMRNKTTVIELQVANVNFSQWDVIPFWPKRASRLGDTLKSRSGAVIMDKTPRTYDYKYHKPLSFDGDDIIAISNAEEWLNGLECSECYKVLIEEYKLECKQCNTAFIYGEEALEAENKGVEYCDDCIKNMRTQILCELKLRLFVEYGNTVLVQKWSRIFAKKPPLQSLENHLQHLIYRYLKKGWGLKDGGKKVDFVGRMEELLLEIQEDYEEDLIKLDNLVRS